MKQPKIPILLDHGEPALIRIPTAARLIDTSAAALRKRLARTDLPRGILLRWGRVLMIDRKKFFRWLAEGAGGP